MYQDFYSFRAMPFLITPDSRFYFGSQEHRKAMAFLQYGLAQREGFVVITGEIGAGKTTLVEHLLSMLDPGEYVIARVVTTQLDGYDTLRMIANGFGVSGEGLDKGSLINRVGQFFAGLQSRGKHPLVIVDEAQSLTVEAIEELRMLSNLAVGARAPFQGIFLGQPEFRVAFASPGLQQFRQRVIASCHLDALNAEDTRKYIEHRLTHVGWVSDPSFSDAAFEEIHRRSGGIPRRVNSLCSRLLLLGYLEERHAIDSAAVASVAQEMEVELGIPDTVLVWPKKDGVHHNIRHDLNIETDEIWSRLARLERAADKHEMVIRRVLDLALKYLRHEDAK